MKNQSVSFTPNFSAMLELYFTDRLIQQRNASPHTIASYRDTFKLLLKFANDQLSIAPSKLDWCDIDASFVCLFLDNLERCRSISHRTRNLRLTAIRSFFKYASFYLPERTSQIKRVLAIPSKRYQKTMICDLTRTEIEALLAAPNKFTWLGRRDHAILMLALQTGLRLSELTGLDRDSIHLGRGAHVRCMGKGRKERCTPLTKQTVAVLKAWIKTPALNESQVLFPTIHGHRASADTIQYLVKKYVAIADRKCPSLKTKKVSPHTLRHFAAMELLEAGVDTTVIALWLGHESVETTQNYLHAHLALKEAALEKINPIKSKAGRYQPEDQLMKFLSGL